MDGSCKCDEGIPHTYVMLQVECSSITMNAATQYLYRNGYSGNEYKNPINT